MHTALPRKDLLPYAALCLAMQGRAEGGSELPEQPRPCVVYMNAKS